MESRSLSFAEGGEEDRGEELGSVLRKESRVEERREGYSFAAAAETEHANLA